MSSDLERVVPVSTELAQLAEQAQSYARAARSPRTVKAYASDWRHFSNWCAERGLERLPATPITVAMYVTDMAANGLRPATIDRRLVAINREHKVARAPQPGLSPEVKETLAGVRRSVGTAQRQVAALLTDDLKSMLSATPDSLRGLRNRAVLLLGFAGAFRRTELVSLNRGDLDFQRNGLVVTLRRSKTDQEGRTRRVGIPFGSTELTCPVRGVQRWLEAAEISRGAVFRAVDRHDNVSSERLSDRSIARLVKEHAELVGLDPSRYAGHSLRAGLATSAADGGASDRAIMRQTGHRSTAMVNRYVREGRLFRDNAAVLAGL
ncbi:MAG TPA: site-specific integrase [Chloroflexota bacterium]|jgi:integrase